MVVKNVKECELKSCDLKLDSVVIFIVFCVL